MVGHVKITIPEPQPPEILRVVLGPPQCGSWDNTLRKTACPVSLFYQEATEATDRKKELLVSFWKKVNRISEG